MNAELEQKPSVRSDRMRDGLVAMVDASPYVMTRRPRKLMVLGAVGLVAAGIALGGSVSAAAVGAPNNPALQGDLQNDARFDVSQSYGKLVGQPQYVEASGRRQINLGKDTHDAGSVEIAYQCLDAGTYTITVDGASSDEVCSTSQTSTPSTRNPQTESFELGKATDHVIEMDSHGGNRFALWVSFVRPVVPAGPSAQQIAAIADGVVTRDEYVEAFARYQGCMAQAGFPQGIVPMYKGEYEYGISEESVRASDTQCYPREYQKVDELWQGEHEKS